MSQSLIFRRKLTHTLEATFPHGFISQTPVKVITLLEDPALEAGWKPIVVSFHDDGSGYLDENGKYDMTKQPALDPALTQLFAILADMYQFGAEMFKSLDGSSPPHEKLAEFESRLGTVILTMYDGTGKELQEWTMEKAWPHSVNFGELCYSSDPSVDVEVTWRFKKCTTKKLT